MSALEKLREARGLVSDAMDEPDLHPNQWESMAYLLRRLDRTVKSLEREADEPHD